MEGVEAIEVEKLYALCENFLGHIWRVKVNHRSIYSSILARVLCCCQGNRAG